MLLSDIFNYWMVCVICTTYNQSGYIIDALDGFVMQQTVFPFVCCIVDDASTDGEQEVIRKYVNENFDIQDISIAFDKDVDYGHVSFAQHKTNNNCYFAVIYLKENHYRKKSKKPYIKEWEDNAKYIALCEGDDYWTDPMKLQKQVEFLEEHPEYSLCCHRYKVYDERDQKWSEDSISRLFEQNPNGFAFGRVDNFRVWITKTMTVVYRQENSRNIHYPGYKYTRDVHLNYHLLKTGIGYCFPFFGAVYRKTAGSVYAPLSIIEKQRLDLVVWMEIVLKNKDDKAVQEAYREHVTNMLDGLRYQIYSTPSSPQLQELVKVYIRVTIKIFGYSRALAVIYKLIKSYCSGRSVKGN